MDPGTVLAVASIVIQGIDVAIRGCRRLHEHSKSFAELPDQLDICKGRVMNLRQYLESIMQSNRGLSQTLLSTIKGIESDFNKLQRVLDKWKENDKLSKKDSFRLLKDAPRDTKNVKAIEKSLDRRMIELLLGLATDSAACKVGNADSFLPVVRRPLSRSFRLPDRRHQNLIGREKELLDLQEKILPGPQQARLLNIYGISGTGKTSLVLELASTTEIGEHFATVLWINATSIDAISKQYCEIASTIAQSGARFKDIPAQIDFVLDALAEEAKPTLFIFDDFNRKITDDELAMYLPKNKNYVALFLKEGPLSSDVISHAFEWSLSALEQPAAIELLLRVSKRTADLSSIPSAKKIVDKLCYCPASIVFAGQFISTSGMTLENFLQRFHLYSLMVFRRKGAREHPPNQMAATWAVSLLNFYPSDTAFTQDVQEMLIFCAILHSDVICGYFGKLLLTRTSKRSPWMERCCNRGFWNNHLFFELILGLKDKALINIQDWNPEHCHFTLHSSIRSWLISLKKKPEDLLGIILDVFQLVTVTINDRTKRSILPDDLYHMQMYASSCLNILCGSLGIELNAEYAYELQLHRQEILDYKVQFLTFLRKHPQIKMGANLLEADMLTMYKQCLADYQNISQADNEIIININEEMAGIYMERTEYGMAEQIYKESLQLRGQKMSSNLALCFSKQGKSTEASEAFDEVASKWDQLSTKDLIVDVMKYILHALEVGDYNAGDTLHDKLKGIITTDNEQAQLKAEGLLKISDLFWESRRHTASVEVQLEALAIYESLWGCRHPQWLTAAHSLCRSYFTIKSWYDCEKLYCKVIRGYEAVYGPGNEHTNSARHCRSHALLELGNTDEGLAQHALAFQNMMIEPGLQEELVQGIFGCLSGNYLYNSLDDERLSLYEQTWAAAQTIIEEGHSFRLELLRELVQMYTESGKCKEAEETLQILIADQESLMPKLSNTTTDSSQYHISPISRIDTVVATENVSTKQMDDDDKVKPVSTEILEDPADMQAALTELLVTAVAEQVQNCKLTDDNHESKDGSIEQEESASDDDSYESDSATLNEADRFQTYIHDLESLARLMQARSAFQEAEAVYRKILKEKLQLDSSPDRSTLQTLLDLQYVCEKQERADAAKDYQQKYIEASERWEEDWRIKYHKTFWI